MRHWSPDTNLVEHARLDGYPIAHLEPADRAWVVAGLTAHGITAEETARALGCSLRLVRQIRADPMTQACRFAMSMADELAQARRDNARALAALESYRRETRREIDRLRRQRDRLVNDLTAARRALPPGVTA